MAITRSIEKKDNLELVNIVLDYIRGHSIEEVSLRLKEQCTKFNIACKDRYQTINKDDDDDNKYKHGLDKILDELSVGGSQLHLTSLEYAKKEGMINCYVWDENTLVYLQPGQPDASITLKDRAYFVKTIDALALKKRLSDKILTLHLFYKQIDDLITKNSDTPHIPHTTDKDQIHHYKSCHNLYDVLKTLEITHPRLSVLIDKIDETTPARNWWVYLLVAAGLTATTGIVFYLKENFSLVTAWYERTLPIVVRWLNNTVYLLSKTPLIGILFLGIPLIKSWYQGIVDGSIRDSNKLVKLLFKTAVNTLPIIGYVLCYLAAGAMTVPAVALFITGAVIDVIETLYTVIHDEIKRYLNPLAPATEYHSASTKICSDNAHERNLYIFLVKFSATLLATASVVVWCVFPPSLVIALTCLIFSCLVDLAKHSLITNLTNNYANALQSDLKDICDRYSSQHHTEADVENMLLKQQNMQLEQQNQQLTSEINVIRGIRAEDHTKWMSFFHNHSSNHAAVAGLGNGLDDNNSGIVYN